MIVQEPRFRQNKRADARSRGPGSSIRPLAKKLDRIAYVGSFECRLQRPRHLETRRRHDNTIRDTVMMSRSYGNGETLGSFDDLTCTDDGYFKAFARKARHPRELICRLKCIEDGSETGVEYPVQDKYTDPHGKYDINYGIPANSELVYIHLVWQLASVDHPRERPCTQ